MVNSIRSYYFRQVQEPSVKGFLSLLENAIFPRNDLYLFELLQNAVDDEAGVVKFEAAGSTLCIWHDGREFSPLDVFGLSSVGFSAKSGRTIGFMGVGFKAVYKRYGRVRVRDRTWAFKFEEPSVEECEARRGDGAATNGWVLMPSWDSGANHAGTLEKGCEFNLELPRGGRGAISQDLAVLPHTLPPLLGRTAQIGHRDRAARGAEIAPFSLTWGARSLTVSLDTVSSTVVGDNNIAGNAQMIRVTDDAGREQRWVFVTRSFRQYTAAVMAFAQHTRKTYPSDQHEEFCVFFEVDERGVPKPPAPTQAGSRSQRNGVIHSTLPTKLSVPMGAHVQSSWLLSIDRMDVQALTDNAWNAGLLSQLPRVCVLLLRWIGATHSGAVAFSKARFTVLPRMTRSEKGNLVMDVLETAVDASVVEKAVRNEKLVPILGKAATPSGDEPAAEGDVVRFVRAQQAIRVPDSFFSAGLSAAELEQWLGLPPLATPALGSFSASPLWDCLPQLDGHAVRSRADNLSKMLNAVEGSNARATKAMQVMAAFADEGLGQEVEGEEPTTKLPKFEQWAIFLTREGSCVSASQLRWPEDDFWRSPMAIQQLLEPHILPPRLAYNPHSGGGGGQQRGGKHNKQRQKPPPQAAQGHLLDSTLQRVLQTAPTGGGSRDSSLRLGVWKSAVACVNEAKKSGSTIVDMDNIVKRFFEARVGLRGEEMKMAVNEIITVTAWAQQRRLGYRVSHVLVGDESTLRLVQPRKVYIGSPYTETKLAELAGDDVPCVSPCYDQANGLSVSTPSTRHWREFFLSIGCNEGLRFEPSANILNRSEYRQLPDGKVPQLRKSQKAVVMPYGLGTMNTKQLMVIDCDLSAEWVQLLAQIASRAGSTGGESPACNAFAMLLARLAVDDSTHPDATSTPAAGPAIAGRESDPAAASMNLIPTRRRLLCLPPGQPGALLMDLGPAQWVKRVSSASWVHTERGTKRPAQCSLWTEREKGYRPGMPMAVLPDDVLRALKMSKMATVLEFATADPPKAMERLREVAETTRKGTSEGPACTDEELADIWRSICMSEKQGKLSGNERHELNKLVTQLSLLPGLASSPGSRVTVSRCVTAPKADPDADNSDAYSGVIDSQLVESMTSTGFLVDVSNPSWALVSSCEVLIPLLGIRGVVKTSELGAFVGWVCKTEPAMTPVLRNGLTVATHRLLQQIRQWDAAGCGAALAAIIGCSLKLFCTNGPQSLKSCWRLVEGAADSVRPVVNDDADKAGMLAKEHGFQFAGMFDHLAPSNSNDPGIAGALHAMDKQIIAKLKILFLSSPEFSVKIQTRGEGEPLEDVQVRLTYVLELLRGWCASVGLNAVVESLPFMVKDVKRYKQIVKTFSVPGSAPIKSTSWAVWRRSGTVLLSGDAEDYVAELQAEVYQRIASQLAGGTRSAQLFPGKVLNLLAHLESHRRFAKFLKRDHGIEADDVPELEETIPPAAPMPAAAPAAAPTPVPNLPAAVPMSRGRGRGQDLNKPAWMTTGDMGKPPEAGDGNTDADDAEAARQAALAAELRALAASGSTMSGKGGGKKRKGADGGVFADAEEAAEQAVEDPAAAKRAKGVAADFLDNLGSMAATGADVAAANPAAAPMGAMGRGRGRGQDLNKPAWMTTGDLGQAPPPVDSAKADADDAKQEALATDLRALAASKSEAPAATTEDASPVADGDLFDERFATLPTLELVQLLASLPGTKSAGKLNRMSAKGLDKMSDKRKEQLLAVLRGAVPNRAPT